MTVSKEQLFTNRLAGRKPVRLPGLGSIYVRGLSRDEVLNLQDDELSTAEFEYRMVSKAMVDPELTVAEVRNWAKASAAGEMEHAVAKIRKLSALDPKIDNDREAYKSADDAPDAGVGDEPGDAAGDDPDPAAGDA